MTEVGLTPEQRIAAIDREIAGLGTCGWAKAHLTPEVRAAAAADPSRLLALSVELTAHAKECTTCRIRDEAIERLSRAMPMSWELRAYMGYRDWADAKPPWLRPAIGGVATMALLTLPWLFVGLLAGSSLRDLVSALLVSTSIGGGAGLVGGNTYRALKPLGRRWGLPGALLAGILLMVVLTLATAAVLWFIPAYDGGLQRRWVWGAAGILIFTAGPTLGWLWFRPSRLA